MNTTVLVRTEAQNMITMYTKVAQNMIIMYTKVDESDDSPKKDGNQESENTKKTKMRLCLFLTLIQYFFPSTSSTHKRPSPRPVLHPIKRETNSVATKPVHGQR